MTSLTPKQFLALMLDTPFRNPELASFIMHKTEVQSIEGRRQITESRTAALVKEYWGHLADAGGVESHVVCANCRTVLGIARAEVVVESCYVCKPSGKITEAGKAALSLIKVMKNNGIKSILPVITHLVETPLPAIDKDILKIS